MSEHQITPEDIRKMNAAMTEGAEKIGRAVRGLGQALGAAAEKALDAMKTPEFQAALEKHARHRADLTYIRNVARSELAAGKADIERMFDELYEYLGVRRDDL